MTIILTFLLYSIEWHSNRIECIENIYVYSVKFIIFLIIVQRLFLLMNDKITRSDCQRQHFSLPIFSFNILHPFQHRVAQPSERYRYDYLHQHLLKPIFFFEKSKKFKKEIEIIVEFNEISKLLHEPNSKIHAVALVKHPIQHFFPMILTFLPL